MKKLYVLPLFLMLISCETDYYFWSIDKFEFKKDALNDDEKVKLLYTSNGPDENTNRDYYYHLIVVSQVTGDTVNVLTASQNGFNESSENEVFNFYNEKNIITIISHNKLDINQLDGKNIRETEQIKLKKMAMV